MIAHTHELDLAFAGDPCALFDELTRGRPDTALLESADGDGRNNTQSLLFVRSSLRITAHGQQVILTPLTPGGTQAIAALGPRLDPATPTTRQGEALVLTIPPRPRGGTDAERLQAPTTADVLRLLARGWERRGDTDLPLHLPGVFAYDFVEQLEPLPPASEPGLGFPDFLFYLPELVVRVDHLEQRAHVLYHRWLPQGGAARDDPAGGEPLHTVGESVARHADLAARPLELGAAAAAALPEVDVPDAEFASLVEQLKEHIRAGDVFQIVPSRTFSTPCSDPLRAYRALGQLNPSPHLFFVRHEEFTLFGSSPETCVGVRGTPSRVKLHPIAGTRPRGRTADGTIDPDLDSRMEAELRLNHKELAEHLMLVDLARNDVARISRPGSRQVSALLQVARYSHVMHLCSEVEGELRPELDALHAYLASANMGTLVGAPKIRAAELLRRYERDRRGPYGGAVGYLTDDGELNTAIVIRTACVSGGVAHVRAGAGVVHDSDPQAEADETRAKAQGVIRAIQRAEETPK